MATQGITWAALTLLSLAPFLDLPSGGPAPASADVLGVAAPILSDRSHIIPCGEPSEYAPTFMFRPGPLSGRVPRSSIDRMPMLGMPPVARMPMIGMPPDTTEFTTLTVVPQLRNREEVIETFDWQYPPELRDAGVTGTVEAWLSVDTLGVTREATLHRSSGHHALDEAALRVACVMRFSPA